MVKRIAFSTLYIVFLYGCSSSNSKPLLITFSADSTNIELNNVDKVGLWRLHELKSSDSLLNELVVVLQVPSETDTSLKEMPLDGDVVLTDSNVVFQPAMPFLKGRQYLVITHLNAKFGDVGDMLSGKLATHVKPIQKLLIR